MGFYDYLDGLYVWFTIFNFQLLEVDINIYNICVCVRVYIYIYIIYIYTYIYICVCVSGYIAIYGWVYVYI